MTFTTPLTFTIEALVVNNKRKKHIQEIKIKKR